MGQDEEAASLQVTTDVQYCPTPGRSTAGNYPALDLHYPPELSPPSSRNCTTMSDSCAGVILSVALRVAALLVLLSSIPVGLVWRQDVLPSACYHGKGQLLAGSLTTLFVTGFSLLAGSDRRLWTASWSSDNPHNPSVLAWSTAMVLVFLNSILTAVVSD